MTDLTAPIETCLTINSPPPKHTITFCRWDEESKKNMIFGVLDFDTGMFTGDVDASAKLFFDAVLRMWGERNDRP